MSGRLLPCTAAAALALVVVGPGCGTRVFAPTLTPGYDTVAAGDSLSVKVVSAAGADETSLRYVMDWGDAVDTSGAWTPAGETVVVGHCWRDTGTYGIRARAFSRDRPDRPSGWSGAASVRVVIRHAPVIDSISVTPRVAPGKSARLRVAAHDPAGDTMTLEVNWGDGASMTAVVSSPCDTGFDHVYADSGVCELTVQAADRLRSRSAVATARIVVDVHGTVVWLWRPGAQPCVSPVIAEFAGLPVLYTVCADGTVRGEESVLAGDYAGFLAWCGPTGHLLVGCRSGGMAAVSPGGTVAWQVGEGTGVAWSAPALAGSAIYAAAGDSLFCLRDTDEAAAVVAGRRLPGNAVGAPLVDTAGAVVVGTDSGYVCRYAPGLARELWAVRIDSAGPAAVAACGPQDLVYCSTASRGLRALAPADGSVAWTQDGVGRGAAPAVGTGILFVGTGGDSLLALDAVTGRWLWSSVLEGAVAGTPLVTAGDYLYVLSRAGYLYCLMQADGTPVWACDCGQESLPGGRAEVADMSPTMLSDGNIIVATSAAILSVQGYYYDPLSPKAPWPKWRHDVANSGQAAGRSTPGP